MVLDVGTGTGIVAKAVAPFVDRVIGIDFSTAMMKNFVNGSLPDNCYLIRGDIRESIFNDGIFDRIIARYAFHHFVGFADIAVRECWRMLKPNGKLIICEGTPPSKRIKKDFEDIFALKEERITFMDEDLLALVHTFRTIGITTHWMRNMSIRNWLNSSGLDEPIKNTIYDMHINGSPAFKEDYNLMISKDGKDCLIDMRLAIVVAVK